MNNTIIFLSFLILLLSVMLVIKIKFNFNLEDNRIYIKIYIFNIKIIDIKISIVGLYYQINNSMKLKKLKLYLTKEQSYLLLQIKHSIIDKLYYDDIIFKTEIGLDNAKDTAILIGALNLVCTLSSNYLLLKNNDTRLYFDNHYNFEKSSFNIDFQVKVYFTIFDLFFAIILSFYKRGKYVKQKNKQR